MRTLVTLGETMALFRAEEAGSIAQVDRFRLGIGGAESNVAIGVTRLGGAARWIGRIGGDGLGERVVRELRAEGVDARAVADPDAPTGLMVKSRRVPAVVAVDYRRAGSAGSRLRPEDLPADLLDGAGVLHITGITPALSASAHDAVVAALDRARDAGVRVSFDVNHRSALWDAERAAPVYRALAARADLVFAGADEAELIVGAGEPEALASRLAESGADVVVKLGARGAVAHIAGELRQVPAVPVEAVDTVGAGDAFVAGYLADVLDGADPDRALATASRAGAFACLAPGDWEGLPRRRDLDLLGDGDPVRR